MAQKVEKVGNQLRITNTDTNETTYGNAAWYEIAKFNPNSVVLSYHGKASIITNIEIFFTQFLNDSDSNLTNEADIANYLAPLLG